MSARTYGPWPADHWRARNDERLRQAAPDLLAELKAMTGKFTNCARSSGAYEWVIDEATKAAHAAIARAEGRADEKVANRGTVL